MNDNEKKLLYALGLMWNQYCGEKGYWYTDAGDNASDVLKDNGLLKDVFSDCNRDKLQELLSTKVIR